MLRHVGVPTEVRDRQDTLVQLSKYLLHDRCPQTASGTIKFGPKSIGFQSGSDCCVAILNFLSQSVSREKSKGLMSVAVIDNQMTLARHPTYQIRHNAD